MKKSQSKDDGILDGFSSEEEVRHEEVEIQIKKETEIDQTHREEVKLRLPPPQQIKKKAYSLNPDMATGWAPKNDLPVPVPLIFDSRRTDNIVKRFIEKKNLKMKLVYLGPRYESTFFAWYSKPFDFPYNHIQAPHNMKFSRRAFCGQHWQAQECLIFDSFFQSGNLDCAIQVGPREYDLYMRVDSNTRGHLQWFNFKVTNLQKLQKYKINICNFQKRSTMYSRGQKPYIFSKKKFQKQKKGWEQGGFSISYEPKPGKSAKVLTTDYNCLYKLSFEYYSEYENDQIQVAYCIPYGYSQLGQYLKKLNRSCASKKFLTISKLCNSLGGLEVPLVVVHEKNENQEGEELRIPKKCIVVSGRVHPGESNGSYMMEGFLDFICGDTREARKLRADFIFKIAPMLNPDGVCMGNYRTGVSGKDFNREYHNPDKSIFPEVHAFKNLVIENKTQFRENLLMFLDFHGHSTKKNVFMYGPEFPIIQKHYYECRVYPKLLANHTSMFRYYSCSFRISECKVTTARAVFLKKLMIPFSYTIEASNGFYYDVDSLKDIPFTDEAWKTMGYKIGTSLAQYAELIVYSEKLKYEKMRQRKIKKEGKRKNNNSPSKQKAKVSYGNEVVILSGIEDEKIKKLFAEIKKIESEREVNRNEEDDISEGSSDGEGETDDLAQQKMKALYDVIKDKKEQNHDHLANSYHSSYDDDMERKNSAKIFCQDLQPSSTCTFQFQNQKQKQEQIFKPNASLRGQLSNRGKNNLTSYLGNEKKQKMAARIINFSFIGGDRRTEYKSFSQKHPNALTDGLSIPVVKKPKKDPFSYANNCVLDLSNDGINKSAYVSMLRERILTKEPFSGATGSFMGQNPRKMSVRLEEFRQKKSALGDYQM